MTIPTLRTFTGDTYLNGDDLAYNFETIKTAINGGIADADISSTAGFNLTQVAQNNAIQFFSFAKVGSAYLYSMPVMYDCEIYDASIIAKKTDSADTAVIAFMYDSSANGSEIMRVTLNTATDEVGYKVFNPRIQLKAGNFYTVQMTSDSNIEIAVLRIGVLSKHTKR